jgi:hypothetical protein
MLASGEDRLRELERLNQWCLTATAWQKAQVIGILSLLHGTMVTGLLAACPQPTVDQFCPFPPFQESLRISLVSLDENRLESAKRRSAVDPAIQRAGPEWDLP